MATNAALSIWWLVVPTLVYVLLARNITFTVALVLIGAAIKYAQTRPELPDMARNFLPLLQSLFVFFVLGGNPLAVAAVAAAGVGVFLKSEALVSALEPWWRVQETIPGLLRQVLAVVVSL